jgi:hypothetical protein
MIPGIWLPGREPIDLAAVRTSSGHVGRLQLSAELERMTREGEFSRSRVCELRRKRRREVSKVFQGELSEG